MCNPCRNIVKILKVGVLPLFLVGAIVGGFVLPYANWSWAMDIKFTSVTLDSFACGKAARDDPATCADVFFSSCKDEGIEDEKPVNCLGSFANGGVFAALNIEDKPELGSSFATQFERLYSKYLKAGTMAKFVNLPGLTDSDSKDYYKDLFWAAVPMIGTNSPFEDPDSSQVAAGSNVPCTLPENRSSFDGYCSPSARPVTMEYFLKVGGFAGYYGNVPFQPPSSFGATAAGCDACRFKKEDEDSTLNIFMRLWMGWNFAGWSWEASMPDSLISNYNMYINTTDGRLFIGHDQFIGDRLGDLRAEIDRCEPNDRTTLNDILSTNSFLSVAWAVVAGAFVGCCIFKDDIRPQKWECKPCFQTKFASVTLALFCVINAILISNASNTLMQLAPKKTYAPALWFWDQSQYGMPSRDVPIRDFIPYEHFAECWDDISSKLKIDDGEYVDGMQRGIPTLSRYNSLFNWAYTQVIQPLLGAGPEWDWVQNVELDVPVLFHWGAMIPGLVPPAVKDGLVNVRGFVDGSLDWQRAQPRLNAKDGKSWVGMTSEIDKVEVVAGMGGGTLIGILMCIFTIIVCIVLILRPGDKFQSDATVQAASVASVVVVDKSATVVQQSVAAAPAAAAPVAATSGSL